MDGWQDREERRHQERTWLAYHAGYYSQQWKRFPKYPGGQTGRGKAKRQTPEEQRAAARLWDAAIRARPQRRKPPK